MPSDEYREVLAQFQSGRPFGEMGIDLNSLRSGMTSRLEPEYPEAVVEPADAGGIPCEWVWMPGADRDRRVLYLHGGGYVSGSSGRYLPMAVEISRAAGCVVLLANYRLAPEHPCPAAVEDAVAAYRWLREHFPQGTGTARSTFIAGDSAGGGLTLAALMALRDSGGPLPQGGITFSA